MKRTEAEILNDLARIECQLSPENLHCDGEISRSAAQRKARALTRAQGELIRELGRIPTFNELFPRLAR
jgi:hypothetical protein